MPLDPVTLVDAVLRLTDKNSAGFAGFPRTVSAVASNWGGTAVAFFSEGLVPVPNPAALAAGREAFEGAMTAALGPPGSPTAAAALSAGWGAFAVAYAGATSVGGGVAVPPPEPLVIPVGPPIADPRPPAVNMAAAIFAWAKTGTFVVAGLAPVPWS